MEHTTDRRTFLRSGGRTLGGAVLLGLVGPGLLEACGSSSSTTSPTTAAAAGGTGTATTVGNYGTLDLQLPWIKNVESAGEYIADTQGLFKQVGFSGVNLIAGGPTATPQETVVQTGKAFLGVSSLDATAAAIQKGFNLVVIGTQYQKNPFAIMSLAKNPIANPQAMIGKKIGVQAPNESVWAAFLKANNLDPSKIDKVTAGFDPTPIAQGQVDGWFSFITNEPITLKEQGIPTTTFLLNDFNYPEVGNVFIATKDSVASQKAKLIAAMKAEIMGWKMSLTNPDTGAQLAATKYGQGLTAAEQGLESRAQNALIGTGDALSNGLFYVTPSAQAANVKTLGLGGTTVTTSQLFDMSILDGVYADASLKAVPTPVTS